MKPIEQISMMEMRALDGVLFDLDDTLLDHGRLSEAAYGALFRLREAGLLAIAVTGRPASWGELVARMWPVDGAIAENGALGFHTQGGRLLCTDPAAPNERARRYDVLRRLVEAAQAEFRELKPADDVRGRITDFTFDIGEHLSVPEDIVAQARRFAHERGARTTRSSVHLHYTFDRSDKATGTLAHLRHQGHDPTSARSRFAFIGDSENDATCFSAFALTVGVSNLRGHFSIPPRFITRGSSSAGFVEFAQLLCQARQS